MCDTNKDPTMYKNKTQAIDEQQYHKQRIGVTMEIDKNTSDKETTTSNGTSNTYSKAKNNDTDAVLVFKR
jgi:hypothetical protein